MSVVNTDSDDSGSDTSYNLDQAELDFIFSFDNLSGQVDLNYLGDNDTEDFDLEQAFITYDFGEGSSITAGKFLSFHGWETAEPTGLYQYSYAYDVVASIPGYFNGVAYTYGDDNMDLGISFVDSVFGADGSLSDSDYGVEVMAKFYPAEGLTLYFGYALDNMDAGDTDLFNFWSSYETGVHTFAVEYNIYEQDFGFDFGGASWGIEVDQWLLMWSVAATETGSFTARVSNESVDAVLDDSVGSATIDLDKYTVAWIETLTDNLALVFEYSKVDSELAGDYDAIALEALFTF